MDNCSEFRFSKDLYSKTAILKCAYEFTNRAYIHLDSTDNDFIVSITPKEGQCFNLAEFENELIAQMTRLEIFKQTKDIRRLTVARALASTIVGDSSSSAPTEGDDIDIDKVLCNWFQENDQT